MSLKISIGIFLTILGIAMFVFGIYAFTYQGEYTALFSNTGLICFLGWLPVLAAGIAILIIGIIAKGRNNKKLKSVLSNDTSC